jgi:predicted dehydrogenase
MLNVGIIGCGKMGRVHAEVFSNNPQCRVVGLYNRTREKAETLQKNHPDAVIFDSWQEMIQNDSIDILTISTPQVERFDQYGLAIKHGKHVFLEKPMGIGLEDVKETIDLLQNSRSCFYVDSQIRSNPVIQTVNQLLPKIGPIIHIDMEFSMFRQEIKWKHKLIAGGGVLRELGGHMIDQAGTWLGKAKSVTAVNSIVLPGREVEDMSVNLIEYESGATLSLTNNYLEHEDSIYRGRILGKNDQINFTFSSYKISDASVTFFTDCQKENVGIELPNEIDINSVYPGHMDSFKQEIDRFVDCVANGIRAEDTLLKEWETALIVAASYESTRLDKKIHLKELSFDQTELANCFRRLF